MLQDARAIPNFENGLPNGYKVLQIVPEQPLRQVRNQEQRRRSPASTGEPMNDPGKALSILNEPPNARHIDINVTCNGRKMTMSYDIH